jgi:hypothetical protein
MPTTTAVVPHDYIPPRWPSLYWPIRAAPGVPHYLYYTTDIWRFTLYWTLLFYGAVHIFTSGWAVLMQLRSAFARPHSHKKAGAGAPVAGSSRPQGSSIKQTLGWVWIVPLVYCVVGGIEAVLAGSVVGLILGAVYSAGYYKMSTWMPFLWGLINCLVVILGSFRIQGGL